MPADARTRKSIVLAALLAFVLILAAAIGWFAVRPSPQRNPRPATPAATTAALQPAPAASLPGARTFESAHYRVSSRAGDEQTRRVAAAAESLRTAYLATFPEAAAKATPARHHLVLYRDRDDFKAHNRSRPWAEAYYLAPSCHAYFAEGERNPTHWMVHEATHQLNRELSGFPRAKWVDEGLATYFGTSRLEGGVLRVGTVDPDAYPVWWLPDLAPTGDRDHDVRAGRFVPLRAVITGEGGPDLDTYFNSWYVAYWSLSRFLFHHDGGRHAAGFRRVIAEGGTLAAFERHIGPVDAVEAQWYAYLRALARSGVDRADEVIVVDDPAP